jgi:hypothetical protein
MQTRRSLAAIALAFGLVVAACGSSAPAETTAPEEAGVVGSNPLEVTVSDHAFQRLGIQTAPITASGGALSVPYAAILYDPDGKTWVYTQSQARVFVRTPVDVERIADGVATLKSGPAAGTAVVVVGTEELYGAESGVGDPE